jgi:hypothetical protein
MDWMGKIKFALSDLKSNSWEEYLGEVWRETGRDADRRKLLSPEKSSFSLKGVL